MTTIETSTTSDAFASIDRVFALDGEMMRAHEGRSVVRLTVDGRPHFLKRCWLAPSQVFKGHVRRGLHEIQMIDWLNNNGFAGPRIVQRGQTRLGPILTRVFFLMEEVPGEVALEAAWRIAPRDADRLLAEVAKFAARLHDAGFIHTDFSERHILVGGEAGDRTFRLIDVERATVGRRTEPKAAADLATLAVSVLDDGLRKRIQTTLVDEYVAARKSLDKGIDFPRLFRAAQPTRSF